MTDISEKVLNIGLRTVTLFTRFLFVFIIAKYLDAEAVSKYGLFTATVGFVAMAAGLDYYTFTSREILRLESHQRGNLLKGQLALCSILYVAVLPLGIVFLYNIGWSSDLLLWLAPIVILEHFNQEIFRLLIVLKDQLFGSVVLFFRQGSWVIALVGVLVSFEDSRQLHIVFAFWAIGGFVAAGLGYWRLKQHNFGGWDQPIDWRWLRKGIGISVGFLVGTLAIRAIHTTDRYWLDALGGHEMLAAYVLYFGVASSLLTFLDAGVFSYTYPKLIQYFHQKDDDLAMKLVRKSLLQTIAFCLAFGAASWLLLPYLLLWIDNSIYNDEIGLYPWILSMTAINALSMIPHYALYARGMIIIIVLSHIVALATFTGLVWVLSNSLSGISVLFSLNASFIAVLIIKTIAY